MASGRGHNKLQLLLPLIFIIVLLTNPHSVCSLDSTDAMLKTTVSSINEATTVDPNVTKIDLDPVILNQTLELQLGMVVSEVEYTLIMYEAKVITVNYTLYCIHPSVKYMLTGRVNNRKVAMVNENRHLNLTCESATSPTAGVTSDSASVSAGLNTYSWALLEHQQSEALNNIPVVRGSFNFTLYADLLGRTWLEVFGARYSDPEAAVLPWVLAFAWEQPKTLASVLHPTTQADTSANPTSRESYDIVKDDVTGGVRRELQRHVITVLRVVRPIDSAFRIILYGFVMLSTIEMGCKLEFSVVKEVLKKPIAPAIGFICQYLFMPLIAYMLARTLTVGDPAVSLGIFACGICPGGGASNMFSYLLDGDVSLSITMTAISSIGAFAMIPLWLFTLGTHFEDDKISLKIPFGMIILTLVFLLIPLIIGILIKRFLPKVAKWILKALKPFSLIALVFMLTVGIYTNLYVFRLFAPRTLGAGCLLPYIGYFLGGLTSAVLRQPFSRTKTIAIETGIQNTSIAYLLLVFSLPAPDGDMAAVGPMASALMTPLPLILLVIVYLLYKRFCKKKKQQGRKEGEVGEEEGVSLSEEKLEEDEEKGKKKKKKGDLVAPIYKPKGRKKKEAEEGEETEHGVDKEDKKFLDKNVKSKPL